MKIRLIFYSFILWSLVTSCHDDSLESKFNPFIWSTSAPSVQGINSQILDSAFIAAENLGYMDGLLVIRNGYLIAAQYYNGYNVNTPHNIKSVSKSFLSALSGIAIQKGYFKLENKVMDYFPEYVYDTMDVRKYDITIDDLMIMRMGIDIDYWSQDPLGYYFGGSEMFFTPREMAVLGYLYLNGGKLRDG